MGAVLAGRPSAVAARTTCPSTAASLTASTATSHAAPQHASRTADTAQNL